jgi:hypothetical protein
LSFEAQCDQILMRTVDDWTEFEYWDDSFSFQHTQNVGLFLCCLNYCLGISTHLDKISSIKALDMNFYPPSECGAADSLFGMISVLVKRHAELKSLKVSIPEYMWKDLFKSFARSQCSGISTLEVSVNVHSRPAERLIPSEWLKRFPRI